MQEQIHIHPHLPFPAEKLQKLCVVELRLQEIIQRHLRARPRNGNRPITALERKDADLVARDGEIDMRELAFRVAAPGDEDAPVCEFLGRVFEGAEFGDAAGALEFALVVPLFGEGHEEAFLALFVLEGHHGLFDVVVVGLELLFEVGGLVVEAGEGKADAFEFALALDAPPVFGADVDSDFVEDVLVVVSASEVAGLFKAEDVFERSAFEFGVGHGGNVDERGGFRVGASAAGGGGELVTDESSPAIFVFYGYGLDHDFHQVRARLYTDDIENAAFGLHEKCFGFSVRI